MKSWEVQYKTATFYRSNISLVKLLLVKHFIGQTFYRSNILLVKLLLVKHFIRHLHELEERLLPHWLPADHHFRLIPMMMMMIIDHVHNHHQNIHLMMIEMPDWSKQGATKSITSSLSLVIVIAATTISTCNIVQIIRNNHQI